MKKILLIVLSFLFMIPVKALDTSAQCAILMDQDSHRILYGENIHTVRSVASISKIMTAILAVESGKLKDTVVIDETVLKAYGSGVYIQVGEHITLEDLVYGLMLRSGNDAALAIANYVGKDVDHFVEQMNQKGKEIGMKNTTFHNPSGLDEEEGNYSTAYDMAILTSYAMKNTTYQKIVKTKKRTVKTDKNTYVWTNKNKLLSMYDYTTGGKTGFTKIAKRTLVSTASKDHLNLVAVTLNDGNDFEDHMNLYREAFESYKSYQLLKKGDIHVLEDHYYENDRLILKNNYAYPLLKTEIDSIFLKIELEKKTHYQDDEAVGKVKVMAGDTVLHEETIYVSKQKPKKESFFTKVKKWIGNLW